MESLIAAAGEQGFPQYLALGQCLRGWLGARRGNITAGLKMISVGRSVLVSLGGQRETAYVDGLMADVLAWTGRKSEVIRLLDETLLRSASTGVVAFDARIRCRKAMVLATGSDVEMAAAEQEFRRAIDIARQQSAKLFELQSCCGLARLWLRQGRPADVQGLLEPVLDWFTEGLTLPDLRDAREVLAECGP
jgi:predicted ATPase